MSKNEPSRNRNASGQDEHVEAAGRARESTPPLEPDDTIPDDTLADDTLPDDTIEGEGSPGLTIMGGGGHA